MDTCVYLFNKPFPDQMLHPFPRHLYRNSPVIQLESSNISAVSLSLFLFFDKNTFIQKRRWKKEPFVLARFTPAESGEIKLYRPRYLEYFPRYLTRLRFPKIYESARDLTRDSVCESRCDTTPLFHQFPRKLRCLLSFNR